VSLFSVLNLECLIGCADFFQRFVFCRLMCVDRHPTTSRSAPARYGGLRKVPSSRRSTMMVCPSTSIDICVTPLDIYLSLWYNPDMVHELKTCEICGKIIPKEYNRNWNMYAKKRFCSRACSAIAHSQKVILTCLTCGKSFHRSPAQVKNKTYCSQKCRQKRQSYICEVCGKPFTERPSMRAGKHIYCSQKCQGVAKRVKKPVLICDFCGDEFERYPSELTKAEARGYTYVFCSHKCRASMIAAQFTPPKTYNGEHTSDPRNGTRLLQWRKAVKERDNYTCQMCGANDKMTVAHHKQPFALFPELRYDVSNGITLCYDCHEKLHSLQTTSE